MALLQQLTYVGNCADALYDRILGPDTAGGYLRVVEAAHDPELDLTRVRVAPLEPDFTGWRFDAHGLPYYVDESLVGIDVEPIQ